MQTVSVALRMLICLSSRVFGAATPFEQSQYISSRRICQMDLYESNRRSGDRMDDDTMKINLSNDLVSFERMENGCVRLIAQADESSPWYVLDLTAEDVDRLRKWLNDESS